MANIPDNFMQFCNKDALNELKKKAESGELSDMVRSADSAKVAKMLETLGLQDKIKQKDIDAVIRKVKQNPNFVQDLKNKL